MTCHAHFADQLNTHWRNGVGFEHEKRCGHCNFIWEPDHSHSTTNEQVDIRYKNLIQLIKNRRKKRNLTTKLNSLENEERILKLHCKYTKKPYPFKERKWKNIENI